MKKQSILTIIYSFAISLVFTLMVIAGILRWPDQWVQDLLYQKPRYMDGEVILFGIDERTLIELGPYNSWDRHVMARALEQLASDPDHLPAVVAVDTMYFGESDPEADAHLVEAAKNLGCVITAVSASFDSGWYETEDGSVAWNDYRIVQYEEPFEALKEVTTQGHVNVMYDYDGIMRHALLYIDPGQREYYMP